MHVLRYINHHYYALHYITDNSADSTVCTCPVPCHRVVYTPDLSYAYLSDATVSKIWKGQGDRLAEARNKYIDAKENVQRVDPDIVVKDTEVFKRMQNLVDDIASLTNDAVLILNGSLPEAGRYTFTMPRATDLYTLFGTVMNSMLILNDVFYEKLGKLRGILQTTIMQNATDFITRYKARFGIGVWMAPPYSPGILDLLESCATLESITVNMSKTVHPYCYSSILNLNYSYILQMQEMLQNLSMWRSHLKANTLKGLLYLFPDSPTLVQQHFAMLNTTPCMLYLRLTQDYYVDNFTVLLQDTLAYNGSTRFADRWNMAKNIMKTLEYCFHLPISIQCTFPYDQCSGLTQINSYSQEYYDMAATFSVISEYLKQGSLVVLQPMGEYLNNTISTKSELYQLIHSDEYEVNNIEMHAHLSTLKKDGYKTGLRNLEQFNRKLVNVVQNHFNCVIPILDQSDLFRMTMLDYIGHHYLHIEIIANQMAKVNELGYYNASEVAYLTTLAFRQQMDDFQTIVETLINHKTTFAEYISDLRKSLVDFENLDNQILQV